MMRAKRKKLLIIAGAIFFAATLALIWFLRPAPPRTDLRVRLISVATNASPENTDWRFGVTETDPKQAAVLYWNVRVEQTNSSAVAVSGTAEWRQSVWDYEANPEAPGEAGVVTSGPTPADGKAYRAIGFHDELTEFEKQKVKLWVDYPRLRRILTKIPDSRPTLVTSEWVVVKPPGVIK